MSSTIMLHPHGKVEVSHYGLSGFDGGTTCLCFRVNDCDTVTIFLNSDEERAHVFDQFLAIVAADHPQGVASE